MGMSAICDYVTEKREGLATYSRRIYERTNLPKSLGAVDGMPTMMCNLDKSGSLFLNYKNLFSSVLMALVDANYCFISLDVGTYGASSDCNIFKNNNFCIKL
jgi:hypothetical protein